MKDSLGREPRWNADSRAAPSGAAAAPARRGRTRPCVCRRFASDFLSLFPFFVSVIRAKVALANASTGICLLRFCMEHRVKSVVTVHVNDVRWLRALRCVLRTVELNPHLSPLGRGRERSERVRGFGA